MIVLDRRAGSIDLLPYLKSFDVPVEVDTLNSADAMFLGLGEADLTVRVGLEVKTISDLVSSMRTKRLSGHQLNGLCSDYEFAWVMVIGPWRSGEYGELVYLRGRDWRPISDGSRSVLYRAAANYLTTLRLRAGTDAGYGLQVERVNDNREAAAFIVSLYHWFQKPWEQHRSHEAVYNKEYVPSTSTNGNGGGHKPRSFIRRNVSWCEQAMATFEGLDVGARFVADKFGSIEALCLASVAEIAATPVEQMLKGGGMRVVRLGEKKAERIWHGLRSRN